MQESLKKLLDNAYAPYSNFRVAAIVKTKDGKYIGVVVDVDNYGSADILSINCGGTTYMVPYIDDTLQFDKANNIFIIDEQRFMEIRVW